MRHHMALLFDLGCVALSAIVAVLIRDNFVLYEPHLEAVTVYAAIAVATSSLVFVIASLHKRLWQYTSLSDVLQIMGAVTVALLLALSASFVLNRLEDVARSVPLIQWFILLSAMVGTRVGFRIWHERKRRDRFATTLAPVQHVLIVGLSPLTELYLRSVAEYASKDIDVVGILSQQRELHGRLLRFHKVLGAPEDLPQVTAELEVHGVTLDRIVVMQPAEELSPRARNAVLAVEKSSSIQVDWLVECLGLTTEQRGRKDEPVLEPVMPQSHAMQASLTAREAGQHLNLGKYGYVKRALDMLVAMSLIVLLAPLMLLVGLLVALDVGFPLVFWQKRPGRFGRPFKLFKFCTMRPAHDAQGKRVPDGGRSSVMGRLLQATGLDEMPQLYNILIGEMSFVGPRPLLPVDQPVEKGARLSVRPGLTGLAQVHGGRDISPEDKNALDLWYIRNGSLWLDIKLLLRTPLIMMRGERIDHYTLRAARAWLKRPKTPSTISPEPKGVVGEGEVKIVHPVS